MSQLLIDPEHKHITPRHFCHMTQFNSQNKQTNFIIWLNLPHPPRWIAGPFVLLCVIAVLVSSDQGQCQGAGACAGTTSGLKLEPAAAGSSHPSPAPVTLLLHSVTSPPSSEWALTVISQPRLRSRLRARVTGPHCYNATWGPALDTQYTKHHPALTTRLSRIGFIPSSYQYILIIWKIKDYFQNLILHNTNDVVQSLISTYMECHPAVWKPHVYKIPSPRLSLAQEQSVLCMSLADKIQLAILFLRFCPRE